MKLFKQCAFFFIGGSSYVALELLWRRRSHISMFLAGGLCFLLLGALDRRLRRIPWLLRALAGAAVITAAELTAGLLVNRQFRVWDYRAMPFNLLGQVCLPFSLLWIPLSLGAMGLYSLLERRLPG